MTINNNAVEDDINNYIIQMLNISKFDNGNRFTIEPSPYTFSVYLNSLAYSTNIKYNRWNKLSKNMKSIIMDNVINIVFNASNYYDFTLTNGNIHLILL